MSDPQIIQVANELQLNQAIVRSSGSDEGAMAGRFVMGRKDILPVCIKAGALEENIPVRDLWLSPHHAMYLDGMLIEARHLVNGVSVVQVHEVETVEYFHIELDSHDVIFAEGALSETYLDEDNRALFHNAREYAALYPRRTAALGGYCAPRLEDGYEVEAVRRRVARRAGVPTPAKAGYPMIVVHRRQRRA